MKRFIKFLSFVIIAVVVTAPIKVFATYDEQFYSNNNILFYNPDDTGSSICGASDAGVSSLVGANNKEKIWNYLRATGLSDNQAAGVLGNIQSESGGTFSPTVNEFSQPFGKGGYGIVQWTGGRRDAVVNALNTSASDLMAKYYNADYSTNPASYSNSDQGYVPKSASTGQLMPVADNDKLLLIELNFLLQEAQSRQVSSDGISHADTQVSANTTEWDAVKQQTTVAGASNVWVYSFEVPADINTTAVTRANNGNAILSAMTQASTAGTSGSCPTIVDGNKQQLAQEIVNSGNISYNLGNLNSAKQIIEGVANGTNNGNDWPCGVNILVLKSLAALTKTHKIAVNSFNRACSNTMTSDYSSLHYDGNGSAIDFGSIDGLPAYSQAGANQIIGGIAPYLVNNSGIGQSQSDCVPNISTMPSGIKINHFNDLCNHLHVDFPPNADPSLKCKLPVYDNACDASQQVQ